MIKKLFAIIFIFSLLSNNVIAIEADIFVQSTVNRASKLLSENITKEEKIKKLQASSNAWQWLKDIVGWI